MSLLLHQMTKCIMRLLMTLSMSFLHMNIRTMVYLAMSNNPNNNHQLSNSPVNMVWEISGKPTDELNGFCMQMTKESIKKEITLMMRVIFFILKSIFGVMRM